MTKVLKFTRVTKKIKGIITNVQRKVNDYEVFVWSRESSIVTYVSGLAL